MMRIVFSENKRENRAYNIPVNYAKKSLVNHCRLFRAYILQFNVI